MDDVSTSGTRTALRIAGMVGSGVAAVAGLASVAVRREARRVRRCTSAELDALMTVPVDVAHASLERPDGTRVHYVDTAPGSDLPPVVLLHGITLQWWMWSAVMRLLRDEHRVVAWDMRGFGGSPAGRDGATVEAAAGDLAALLEAADLRDAVIVGHSMGGMVLGRFAADRPDVVASRVRGFVFLSTSARSVDGTLRTGGLVRLSKSIARFADLATSSPMPWNDNDLSVALLRGGFGRVATPKMVDDLRRCQAEAPPQSLVDGSRSIAGHDVVTQLASLDTPTIAMVGSLDRLTPVFHAMAIANAMPNATVTLLDGIGHQTLQEDPHAIAEAVTALHRSTP